MAEYGQENKILTNTSTLIIGGNVSFVDKKIKVGEGNLPYGTVLGETTEGKLRACKSDSTDGSEIPLFVVFQEQGVNGGDTVSVLSSGMIRGDLLILSKEGDTLGTMVEKLSIGNWLRQKFILQNIEGYEYSPEKADK